MKKAYCLYSNGSCKDNFRYEVLNYMLREFELAVRKVDKTTWDRTRSIKPNVGNLFFRR